jgi:hypothetical protein
VWAKQVLEVSVTSAPETSGVECQYGIGVHADSGIDAIAAFTFLSCRAVLVLPGSDGDRTPNGRAVDSAMRE